MQGEESNSTKSHVTTGTPFCSRESAQFYRPTRRLCWVMVHTHLAMVKRTWGMHGAAAVSMKELRNERAPCLSAPGGEFSQLLMFESVEVDQTRFGKLSTRAVQRRCQTRSFRRGRLGLFMKYNRCPLRDETAGRPKKLRGQSVKEITHIYNGRDDFVMDSQSEPHNNISSSSL